MESVSTVFNTECLVDFSTLVQGDTAVITNVNSDTKAEVRYRRISWTRLIVDNEGMSEGRQASSGWTEDDANDKVELRWSGKSRKGVVWSWSIWDTVRSLSSAYFNLSKYQQQWISTAPIKQCGSTLTIHLLTAELDGSFLTLEASGRQICPSYSACWTLW